MTKKRYKSQTTNRRSRKNAASALILAVILTSLLAIIGVMFVMIARVDKMATSAISENKELNFAVETVVAKISQELVLDVPGMPKGKKDYYDYPDANNAWLASLEPYKDGTNYKWRQISDVTGFLNVKNFATQDVSVDPPGTRKYIQEYPEITLDANSELEELWADADGDGIADSKWIKLDNITSNKGKPIYAAIRIVDNGGMLNVNTARQFDPTSSVKNKIDGSSQMQINLFALAQRGPSNTIEQLDVARYGNEPHDLNDYIRDVVWQYNEPNGRYTPFDISDELELRNRFLLEFEHIDTRIEKEVWTSAFTGKDYLHVPVDGTSSNLTDWFYRAQHDVVGPNDIYSYRHIATTFNMDRIIDPNGAKMTNVNTADVNALYNSIRKGLLDANYPDVNIAAQVAVNITDYRDSDSDVNVYTNPDDGKDYYGFESPCIYISELAHKFKKDMVDPNIVYKSYAVELYKPYSGDNDPCNWQLEVGSTPITINNWTGNKQFYVIQDQNSNALLNVNSGTTAQDASFAFTVNTEISLQRPLPGGGYVTVDWYKVDPCIPSPPWLSEDGSPHSIQRDIQPHKCIRRLWASVARNDDDDLGKGNTFVDSDTNVVQAHPANTGFTNVGEIGMLFRKDVYSDIVRGAVESDVRLNLADPNFQQLFKYLTVFDPCDFHPGDANYVNERRVKGRININTAPWFVLAQLPWVSQRKSGYNNTDLAQAIAAYRDKLKTPVDYSGITGRKSATGINNIREAPGFESIGELNFVIGGLDNNYRIDYYKLVLGDLAGFPDLTPGGSTGDGAKDDFEERDVIFSRISNLVTVRSDVFTAYILVRIGADGPQKRVMAILDRSNVYSGDGKVRIVALHPVPDPR